MFETVFYFPWEVNLILFIQNSFPGFVLGFECLLAITFILEIFAIGWFCSWMGTNSMKFYTVANHGIFAVFEVISICTALKIFLEKYQNGTVH